MDSQRFASTYQLKDIQDTYLKIYTEKTYLKIYTEKSVYWLKWKRKNRKMDSNIREKDTKKKNKTKLFNH